MTRAGADASRRRVTALFCDLVGSTDLVTRMDPEPLRSVLEDYFVAMRAVIERHGGVVEKFIGDSVVGVFGIPRGHEDDALRAVRAALEMQTALEELNGSAAARLGVPLVVRIGLGTGVVVSGDSTGGHGLVTGEPLNLAARLQHAAGPGDVLMSSETHALTADRVTADEVGPLSLAGFPAPVVVWHLRGLVEPASLLAREGGAPFVGRTAELARLRAAVTDERCRLVTVVGPAGMGKSRLVRELVDGTTDAQVVVGRCLSYGEGITYWPLAEIVRSVAADSDGLRRMLQPEPDVDAIVDRLSDVVGWGSESTLTVEIQWAARRLFEALAARQPPLIVVLEDIHWAEPTLLDLIEYTERIARGPIAIVATARPELLDVRPEWAGVGDAITLEPLPDSDLAVVARSSGADEALVAHAVEMADGNPLFAEQLVALAPGNADEEPPASIGALLRARIDSLPVGERLLLQCGSIEGRSFHVGGLLELLDTDERGTAASGLVALVRKRLLQPEQPELSGEDAYRFAHILLRDAAYESLPHKRRGNLHERLAAWLEARQLELSAADELIGHHVAEAHAHLAAVSDHRDHLEMLARRAGRLLVRAAFRAEARDDAAATAALLDRGLTLLPPDDPERPRALYMLGRLRAYPMGLDAGAELLTEAVMSADRLGDDVSAALARLEIEVIEFHMRPGVDVTARVASLAASAIDHATRIDDEWALSVAWSHACIPYHMRCRYQDMMVAADASYAHGRACRNASATRLAAGNVARALEFGPTPASAAIQRCRELLTELGSEAAGVSVLIALAVLTAMRAERERAHLLLERMHATAREHGIVGLSENPPWPVYARIATNAGDWSAASAAYQRNLEKLRKLGHVSVASTQAAELARALAHLDEIDEAAESARKALRIGSADDIATQTLATAALALVASKRGAHGDAVDLARSAVGFANRSDWLTLQSDAYLVLADVEARRGDLAGAHLAAEEALTRFQAKENIVGEARAKTVLAGLDAGDGT